MSLPVQSWTGNTYQVGSVEQLTDAPTELAYSFWALQRANLCLGLTAKGCRGFRALMESLATLIKR